MSELRLGQDSKYLENKAKDEGLILFLPEANEIFLDLDGPAVVNERVYQYIMSSIPQLILYSELTTVSKSGNKHVYMRFDRELGNFERVILQMALGSDPVKELFSFLQLKLIKGVMDDMECECPVALFETPKAAEAVIKWREAK